MRVREPRPGLRLELVAGEVLGLEGEGVREIRVEVGGALARDPVDEIERDVVKSGITKSVNRAPDVVGCRTPFEHLEQRGPEGLGAERDAIDAVRREAEWRARASRSPGSPRPSARRRAGARSRTTCEGVGLGERRRPAADEDRLHAVGEPARARARAPRRARRRRRRVLVAPADGGDEVAVAAPVDAERQVDVEVADGAARP